MNYAPFFFIASLRYILVKDYLVIRILLAFAISFLFNVFREHHSWIDINLHCFHRYSSFFFLDAIRSINDCSDLIVLLDFPSAIKVYEVFASIPLYYLLEE
jgi:hypothetical protein